MSGHGRLFVVGLGPGDRTVMTGQALEALRQAEVVVGYGLTSGKAPLTFGHGEEAAGEAPPQPARDGQRRPAHDGLAQHVCRADGDRGISPTKN